MTPSVIDPAHRPAVRWANVLFEPLSSNRDRVHAHIKFREFAASQVNWTAGWFAGVIYSGIHTLPADDPWRHLSARLASLQGDDMVRREPGVPVPVPTMAVSKNGQFGSNTDALDLVPNDFGDPWCDPSLTAVTPAPTENEAFDATPDHSYIDPVAAAMIAFGSESYTTTRQAALVSAERALGLPSGAWNLPPLDRLKEVDRWIEAMATAMRWTAYRRRVYFSRWDSFMHEQCLSWLNQADAALVGLWEPDLSDAEIMEGSDPDATYGLLKAEYDLEMMGEDF